ncbi:hypothetical protein A2U01_0080326, partial [Trifolium medium]|nr:hypothetical protein [Trifolium medium]
MNSLNASENAITMQVDMQVDNIPPLPPLKRCSPSLVQTIVGLNVIMFV